MQIPFHFPHHPSFSDSDFFVSPDNQALYSRLIDNPDALSSPCYLFGERGAGKSHLAHIWSSRHQGQLIQAGQLEKNLLSMEVLPALAIDSIEELNDEPLLFHLVNKARTEGIPLLLTGRTSAHRLKIALPDLLSRLRAIESREIKPLKDQQLEALLAKLLSDRQIDINQRDQMMILQRIERQAGALTDFVHLLDRKSLTEKKPPGRGMIMSLLSPETSALI